MDGDPWYWTAYVLSAYEGASNLDKDPDTEQALRLRMLAAKALFQFYRDRSGVPVLIDLLERGPDPKDDPGGGVVRSLKRITGRNFGCDVAAWRDWWRKQQIARSAVIRIEFH